MKEKSNDVRAIDELTRTSKEYLRTLNEGLNKIRGEISKMEAADADPQAMYDLGFEDGYMLAKKVFGSYKGYYKGYYTWIELCEIFDSNQLEIQDIYELPLKEVREKVEAWERKKKETEELQVGDVVKVHGASDSTLTGIYTGASNEYYHILMKGPEEFRTFKKTDVVLAKTGKHVDILGVLEGE